jgi:hypothetical protein
VQNLHDQVLNFDPVGSGFTVPQTSQVSAKGCPRFKNKGYALDLTKFNFI